MSEQLNAAIERLKQINAGMAFDKVYGGSSDDYGHDYSEDISNVIGHYFEELARRDAERAERAKPITAEWLESIGWKKQTTHGGSTYHEFGLFHWFKGVVSFCSCKLETVTTRGQLLDLLAALKGEA